MTHTKSQTKTAHKLHLCQPVFWKTETASEIIPEATIHQQMTILNEDGDRIWDQKRLKNAS